MAVPHPAPPSSTRQRRRFIADFRATRRTATQVQREGADAWPVPSSTIQWRRYYLVSPAWEEVDRLSGTSIPSQAGFCPSSSGPGHGPCSLALSRPASKSPNQSGSSWALALSRAAESSKTLCIAISQLQGIPSVREARLCGNISRGTHFSRSRRNQTHLRFKAQCHAVQPTIAFVGVIDTSCAPMIPAHGLQGLPYGG